MPSTNSLPPESLELLQAISQCIFDKNGCNILALDVRAISTMTDCYVIAEGNVEKHVQAIARALQEIDGYPVSHIEGYSEGDWVVLDFTDVIVHLFIPELREKYALEELWREAAIIDVPIHLKPAVG